MKRQGPLDILITRQRQTWFWFLLFLLSIAGFAFERARLIASLTEETHFVIMDDDTFYLPKSVDFESASEIHASQVTLAMETLFNRNPKGLDNPNRVKRLFDKSTGHDAFALVAQQAEEFAAKEIHQKVEAGNIQLLQVSDDSVLATAKGQLIRNGIFDGEAFIEVFKVKARLTFARNPSMLNNGGFPTVVTEFEVSIVPSKPMNVYTIILGVSLAAAPLAVGQQVTKRTLSSPKPVTVKVSDRHTTTILFPKPINAIIGNDLTDGNDGNETAAFQYNHPPNSRIVALIARDKNRDAPVVVAIEDELFLLNLAYSQNPNLAVTFTLPKPTKRKKSVPVRRAILLPPLNFSPPNLLRLLELANAHRLPTSRIPSRRGQLPDDSRQSYDNR